MINVNELITKIDTMMDDNALDYEENKLKAYEPLSFDEATDGYGSVAEWEKEVTKAKRRMSFDAGYDAALAEIRLMLMRG